MTSYQRSFILKLRGGGDIQHLILHYFIIQHLIYRITDEQRSTSSRHTLEARIRIVSERSQAEQIDKSGLSHSFFSNFKQF